MPCMTIAIPLQCAATATHGSRRSKGRCLLLQPTQTWPAHEGKRKSGPTRKPPNYPTWSVQRRSKTATKSRRKEARSKVPFAQSPALSDLVRYVHGHTDPESSEEKRTFGSGKETKFQQNACEFEPGAVTSSQKAPRKENECPRRHAKKSKPEKSAPERKRMYNEAKSCEGQRCQNVSKKADINF